MLGHRLKSGVPALDLVDQADQPRRRNLLVLHQALGFGIPFNPDVAIGREGPGLTGELIDFIHMDAVIHDVLIIPHLRYVGLGVHRLGQVIQANPLFLHPAGLRIATQPETENSQPDQGNRQQAPGCGGAQPQARHDRPPSGLARNLSASGPDRVQSQR